MAKTSSKKHISAKYDVVIKAKATTTRIVDINNEIVRFESNDKGQVIRKHYSGVHWDTVESTTGLLFDTLRALRIIILKEKANAIFVNVSVGSKIQAIASMMACMMFKDEVNIRPYYAVPEQYETIPREQETVGLKQIVTLPEYKIEIPSINLIRCLEIIHQRVDNTISKKELRDEAIARNLIHVERQENKEQSAYMALKNNLLDPLLSKWEFIQIKKIGRRHNILLTEEGMNALRFLSTAE